MWQSHTHMWTVHFYHTNHPNDHGFFLSKELCAPLVHIHHTNSVLCETTLATSAYKYAHPHEPVQFYKELPEERCRLPTKASVEALFVLALALSSERRPERKDLGWTWLVDLTKELELGLA